ncbi:MAG TPA: tRNA lysidine(34) synthetase TilS [Candidatus Polarisedimenticolaceae bacterium]|nr:tRNA lysidine(34) synthetase TilS [Candidatus Polarisedimenticolaceae bacterium]
MSRKADPVEIAFHRAVRGLVPDGAPLVVAVSGGGDSVALLHLVGPYAARHGIAVTVAHLDHGLRRGSAADRRFVEALAATLRLPVVAERCLVKGERRRDESLEEAARRVRRAFLMRAAERSGASLVATGHTQDDQAETILMRFARGAGPAALAAMAPSGPGPFVRPLLGLERAELRAWLRRRRHAYRDDPTNDDLAFDRNRVRRLVVPALMKAVNPQAARHLVEAAARLRSDAAFLDALALERFDAIATRRGGRVGIDAAGLASLPGPLASRVARLALVAAGCDPRHVSARHVGAVVGLAALAEGASIDLPGKRRAEKRRGRIVL